MRVRRLSPQDRRRQIVDAARTVIAERGLASMSLRDIARAAEVSLGTVTYHFASIDELLGALVLGESDRFYGEVIITADATADARQALQALMAPMFRDSTETVQHWRIWSDYWGVVARRPEVAAVYAERVRSWEACCVRTIERGVHQGVFRPVDPAAAALKLAAYADGLGTQLAQRAAGLDAATALAWMLEFVDLLLQIDRSPSKEPSA